MSFGCFLSTFSNWFDLALIIYAIRGVKCNKNDNVYVRFVCSFSVGLLSRFLACRADLKPIGSIAPNWASGWSYLLSAVQVHTTTHCMFYREQLVPVLPKTDPAGMHYANIFDITLTVSTLLLDSVVIYCWSSLVKPRAFYWSVCIKPGKWAVMYLCIRGIDFDAFYDLILDFRAVPTVYYFGLFFFGVFH